MTFSKHNWNQLSESSKRELKRRQAFEQGYQDALNEAEWVSPADRYGPAPNPWDYDDFQKFREKFRKWKRQWVRDGSPPQQYWPVNAPKDWEGPRDEQGLPISTHDPGGRPVVEQYQGIPQGIGYNTMPVNPPPSGAATGREMATSSGGMTRRNMGAGESGQLSTGIRVNYPPDTFPKGTTHVDIDENGNVYAMFKLGDAMHTILIGTGYQAGPPATYIPTMADPP